MDFFFVDIYYGWQAGREHFNSYYVRLLMVLVQGCSDLVFFLGRRGRERGGRRGGRGIFGMRYIPLKHDFSFALT